MHEKPVAQAASSGRLWHGMDRVATPFRNFADAGAGDGGGSCGDVSAGAMQEARALHNLGKIEVDDDKKSDAWIDVDLFNYTARSEGRSASHGHRASPASRPTTSSSTQSSREHSWHIKRSWARPSQQHDKNAWTLGSELMKLTSEKVAVEDARRTGSTIRQLTVTCLEAHHLDLSAPPVAPQLLRADAQQGHPTASPDSKQLRPLAIPRAAPRHLPEHHWTAPSMQARPRPSSTTSLPASCPLPYRRSSPQLCSKIRENSRGSMQPEDSSRSAPRATLQLCMHLLPSWKDAHANAR